MRDNSKPLWSDVRRRLALLTRGERLRWMTLFPIGVLTAALETVGSVVVFALIALLTGNANALTGTPAAHVASILARTGLPVTMMSLTLLVAGLYLVKNGVLLVAVYYRARVGSDIVSKVSARVSHAYLRAPYTFHLNRSSADLAQRVLLGIPAIVRLLDSVVTLTTEFLVVVGLVLVLMQAAFLETIVATAIIGGILGIFVRTARGRYHRFGAEHFKLSTQLLKTMQHALGGIKEVKAFGRERYFGDALAREDEARTRVFASYTALESVPRLLIETTFVLGLVGLVAVLELHTGPTGSVLPFIGLYAYAGLRMIPAGQRLSHQTGNIRYELAASDALCGDVEALTSKKMDAEAEPSAAHSHFVFRQRVCFEDVSFAYENSASLVLRRIDLQLLRGECLAIVGATGSGKTTLVDLLLGLIEPIEGRVTVDGVSITKDVRAWRRHIGYVSQDPFLVDDTLRRNIAFGIADPDVDETAVISALEIAQLRDFVAALPDGLDTVVGERGVRLSGGERQRVSIARALYLDPELLIFDEATSSLDPATEKALTEAIERLKGRKTILVIAHRLSTVERADRLVLLRNGRIAATGSYTELARSNDEFRALAALTD